MAPHPLRDQREQKKYGDLVSTKKVTKGRDMEANKATGKKTIIKMKNKKGIIL